MGPYVYVIYLLLAITIFGIFWFIKAGGRFWLDRLLGIIFLISVATFYFSDLGGSVYTVPITEPGWGDHYEAFAADHVIPFYIFLLLSTCALCAIWWKGLVLPPIIFVCLWSLIVIGICLHLVITIHIGFNLFSCAYWIIGVVLLVRNIRSESALVFDKVYDNRFLNFCNRSIGKASRAPIWILILAAPIALIIMLILVLFGQDTHAMIKVFTETTTYTFSQKPRPPYLPHHGHYLCTVAAHGDPKIVKPLGWGVRHGRPIIINRQLQIANAFEELIQDGFPKLHKMIRYVYDKYGYPLSEKIDTPCLSNLIYVLMKPLEWSFLLVLYTFCTKPEEKISRQYS